MNEQQLIEDNEIMAWFLRRMLARFDERDLMQLFDDLTADMDWGVRDATWSDLILAIKRGTEEEE